MCVHKSLESSPPKIISHYQRVSKDCDNVQRGPAHPLTEEEWVSVSSFEPVPAVMASALVLTARAQVRAHVGRARLDSVRRLLRTTSHPHLASWS